MTSSLSTIERKEGVATLWDRGSEEFVMDGMVDEFEVRYVLLDRFPKGYLLQSTIERKKFCDSYQKATDKVFPYSSENIDDIICSCGIVCGKKVFVPEAMLLEKHRKSIHNFISDTFAEGRKYIYYEYLFNTFHDVLLSSEIIDASRLKSYLQHYYSRDWLFFPCYIATSNDVSVNVNSEVIEYVRECGRIVTEEEVVKALPYLPTLEVIDTFYHNNKVLITATRKAKFHIELLEVSPKELDKICRIIDTAIEGFSYISANELFAEIRSSLPMVLENNAGIPDTGICKALKILLGEKYSYNETIISRIGHKISPEDILTGFAKKHTQFTLRDISNLAKELGASLDYQLKNIYRYAIRVDNETFVSRNSMVFDVKAIDKAIDKCFEDKHIFFPLTKVTNFISFPQLDYIWNQRLLESYLTVSHDSRYDILYSDYMRGGSICGVIIEKSHCDGWTFIDVLAHSLAGSNLSLQSSDEALEFCAEEGYIIYRRLKGIDDVVAKAIKIREERNNQ